MAKIFKPRRGSSNVMSTTKANTVLASGEIFFETPNGGIGSGEGAGIKMGDGTTAYSNLPYFMKPVDVSSAQVTVTADNSSTSTAAINNVSSGATTGALIGSLKQAISLTKSELTNTIDEVYQAALAAGSGGIRWNSETKWVQLADENKNWIDWRYYNPNYEVTHDFNQFLTNTSTVFLSKRGLYCLSVSGYNNGGNGINTNATIRQSFNFTIGSGYYSEYIVYSEGSSTATLSVNASYSGSSSIVIYIGSYSNATNPDRYAVQGSTEKTFTTHNQFIHLVLRGASRQLSRTFSTENIEAKEVTIYDPGSYNVFSAAAVNKNGKVYVNANGGVESNNVGGLCLSSYTLVE